MTITLTWGHVPLLLAVAATAAMLVVMFRRFEGSNAYGLEGLFRLLWLIPIGFMWAGYFGGLLLYRAIWGPS